MARQPKVAIYVPVSTDEQDPDSQLRDLGEYVRSRGWTDVAEYVDLGVSGAKDRRYEWGWLAQDELGRRMRVSPQMAAGRPLDGRPTNHAPSWQPIHHPGKDRQATAACPRRSPAGSRTPVSHPSPSPCRLTHRAARSVRQALRGQPGRCGLSVGRWKAPTPGRRRTARHRAACLARHGTRHPQAPDGTRIPVAGETGADEAPGIRIGGMTVVPRFCQPPKKRDCSASY
jgi:hypothetical protein